MKKWLYLFLSLFAFSFFSMAYADTEVMTGQEVIEHWFAAMKNNDVDKAASYLAPQFVSIHTDGIVRDKAGEVDLIKNLNMKSYKLTAFKTSTSGDVMVVTFKDQGAETIDKTEIDPKAAGRMAVLQKQEGQWLILAYANLDTMKK